MANYPPPPGGPPQGPPPGYGAPPPQGPPPGYGAPPPQGPPPGYGAPPPQGYGGPPPPGYGAPPPQGYGAPTQQYGSFIERAVAYLIDAAILGIPFIVLFIILAGMMAASLSTTTVDENGNVVGAAGAGAAGGLMSLLYLVFFVAFAAYFVVQWSRGATIGQRIMHLRVVDATTGGNISMGKAFLRLIGRIVAGAACYIGLLWVLWDPQKQGWQDKIAGTYVVKV